MTDDLSVLGGVGEGRAEQIAMSMMEGEPMGGAEVSTCGLYRYSLWRRWDRTKDVMVWLMLNPSTADASVDDPTIRRCIGFAKREGCGGIEVLNLYALRATKPTHLLDSTDPEGPLNRHSWDLSLRFFHRGPVVAAWGASRPKDCPSSEALNDHAIEMLDWKCLGHTASGSPRHPLYVKADAPLVPL